MSGPPPEGAAPNGGAGDMSAEQGAPVPRGEGQAGSAPTSGADGGAPQAAGGGARSQTEGVDDPALMRFDVPVQYAQDAISDPVSLSGVVDGDCSGRLVIDLLGQPKGEPGDQPADGGDALDGPITRLELDGKATFTLKAPKGVSGAISASCDVNGDGAISKGDLISRPLELETLTADKAELTLKLEGVGAIMAPARDGGLRGDGGPPAVLNSPVPQSGEQQEISGR